MFEVVHVIRKPTKTTHSYQTCSKQDERQYWTECSVAIWETGEWPEEWTFSTFIPLPKKGDLKQCANYRTIALVSHASKILLWIILEWIRVKTKTEITDEQVGFRQARGKRDQITNLRILMHKACEHQQPIYTVSQKKTRHQTLAHKFPKC